VGPRAGLDGRKISPHRDSIAGPSFMQGIYTYIPERNNVPGEYIVADILLLLFMVPISLVPALALLCFYVSTFRSMCAVPNMAVFCSSLTWWFPGMLLTYFLNDFEVVPVAQHACSLSIISDYNVWLVIRDGSVNLHLLIPQYGCPTSLTCFY
jgi:lipid-A-disaccharide synthase-like uncharacterized protein